MRKLTLLAALLAPGLVLGASGLDGADPKAGKALHDKHCTSCHQRMYGGDGSKMYTRDGRMLNDKSELLQRVATCSAQVGAGWFPEEEAAVAAYLNQQYYHFKQ